MSEKLCPSCGNSVQESQMLCPYCLYSFKPIEQNKASKEEKSIVPKNEVQKSDVNDNKEDKSNAQKATENNTTVTQINKPNVNNTVESNDDAVFIEATKRIKRERRRRRFKRIIILIIIGLLVIWLIKKVNNPYARHKSTPSYAVASTVSEVEEESVEEIVEEEVEPDYSDQYYFYDSNQRFFSEEEVSVMEYDTIRNAINEIYARHGYIFGAGEIADHFASCDWYQPDSSVTDEEIVSLFNEYETENVKLLAKYRKIKKESN